MTNAKPAEPLARPISELVPPFPSVDWLSRRLNKGIIPGTKFGRSWVMTDHDVREALEIFKNANRPTTSGITPASARLRGAALACDLSLGSMIGTPPSCLPPTLPTGPRKTSSA